MTAHPRTDLLTRARALMATAAPIYNGDPQADIPDDAYGAWAQLADMAPDLIALATRQAEELARRNA